MLYSPFIFKIEELNVDFLIIINDNAFSYYSYFAFFSTKTFISSLLFLSSETSLANWLSSLITR